jgi:hypothetical protein
MNENNTKSNEKCSQHGCLLSEYHMNLALGIAQPLIELSTRSRKLMFLGSKAWPVRRANNLTAIYEPTV